MPVVIMIQKNFFLLTLPTKGNSISPSFLGISRAYLSSSVGSSSSSSVKPAFSGGFCSFGFSLGGGLCLVSEIMPGFLSSLRLRLAENLPR